MQVSDVPGQDEGMATDIEALYKQREGTYIIELVLSDVKQLFNSFDPSPFREKELDQSAQEYIFNAIGDIPAKDPVELVVYLPPVMSTPEMEEAITFGIHNHFRIQLAYSEKELRRLSRRGRKYLLIGLAILLFGVLARQALSRYERNALIGAVDDILLIISWVAIWEPIHIFLYERSPILQKMQIYQKIAQMAIVVRPHHEIFPR
jgi:hypothetical protein